MSNQELELSSKSVSNPYEKISTVYKSAKDHLLQEERVQDVPKSQPDLLIKLNKSRSTLVEEMICANAKRELRKSASKRSISRTRPNYAIVNSKNMGRIQKIATSRVKSYGLRKQSKLFTVNTNNSRGELETLQLVIDHNEWQESSIPFDGHLIWFGLPLRENDVKALLKRPNTYFNRYLGTEYVCRK